VRLFDGREPISEIDRLADVIAKFTATRTKAELVAESRRRRVLLAPVATLRDVMSTEHLAERGVWDLVPVEPGGQPHRHLGRFVVASGTPLRSLGPAPALGADTESVRAETAEPGRRRSSTQDQALANAPGAAYPRPLEGLKVVDLTWSIAGPYVGRTLADFGATVVRVETQKRVDVTRTVMPLHPLNDQHPLECGGLYANSNAGKLGIELDLDTDAGHEVLWDLLRWGDVVLESFSARAFERMGFGYERIKAVNPGAIVLSSCLPGQTGPLDLPGYGNLSSAMFGFHFTTRWPDRPAAGPFGAYTDTVTPRFSLVALLGALDHRRRTGEGQYIDVSQVEASLHFLSPALLDAEVNGNEFVSLGNGDAEMSPHGVYRSVGDDRWIAIACQDDAAWTVLATATGRPDLVGLSLDERLARRSELDDLVSSWTSALEPEEAEKRLQGLGVAAHNVQNSGECLADPQLAHRGHYVTVPHPYIGPVQIEGPRVRLSRTPGKVVACGPSYGEHAYEILTELLGYDPDRFAEVAAAGGLG
jgi:crotonobetainyl-CoA:carnitine CoA-transferase CaiB-like acyl-CoA transferase